MCLKLEWRVSKIFCCLGTLARDIGELGEFGEPGELGESGGAWGSLRDLCLWVFSSVFMDFHWFSLKYINFSLNFQYVVFFVVVFLPFLTASSDFH